MSRQTFTGHLVDDDDYTYYVDAPDTAAAGYEALFGDPRYANNLHSASCSGSVYPGDRRDDCCNTGRLLVCRSFAGKTLSVTMRRTASDLPAGAVAKRLPASKLPELQCKYAKVQPPGAVPYPVKTDNLGEVLDQLVFGDGHPTGLLLITGSTNSGKSELTQSLIYQRVKAQRQQPGRKRWPHVVTYEDPIEKPLFETHHDALANGVEYTPRQKNIDVARLEDALEDALRQTPSLFFVGEVRSDAEWATLLRFAGTGHLVVATSHAGSLIEAMERILRGVKAATPADRGQIAQRILGVIHQTKFNVRDVVRRPVGAPPPPHGDEPFDVFLPALWRRTPGGAAALVSDGLASVLPNRPSTQGKEVARTSSFGRRWFAEKLDTTHWTDLALTDLLRADVAAALAAAKPPPDGAATAWADLASRAGRTLAYGLARIHGGVGPDQAMRDALGALKADAKHIDVLARWLGAAVAGPCAAAAATRFDAATAAAEGVRHGFQSEAVRLDLLGV